MNATSVALPEPLESFSVLAYICAFTRSEVEPLNAEDDTEESDLQALLAKPVPERKRIECPDVPSLHPSKSDPPLHDIATIYHQRMPSHERSSFGAEPDDGLGNVFRLAESLQRDF